MRILDKGQALLSLDDLGFLPDVARALRDARTASRTARSSSPGPTGSGKSTTLYATLNILNDATKNIITVEDPVEYRLPGINQMQINHKAGLTFAAALRSILRSDPDVVLVGEIRDRETATIAIEAALTGHLVLSTLHTNDAASTPDAARRDGRRAVPRDQRARLRRRPAPRPQALRPSARRPYQPIRGRADRARAGRRTQFDGRLADRCYRPVGCGACGKTGYRGRFALHEVHARHRGDRAADHRAALHRGHQEGGGHAGNDHPAPVGLRKVAHGLTGLEEILRVVA